MSNIVQVMGAVEEIIFCNDDNGYTVCEIDSVKEGLFTATGYLPYISEGENLCLTGEWVTHPDYGEQFKVISYETVLPADEESIYRYLAAGIVKGVREATAKRIVEEFGADTFDVMLNAPAKLSKIKGISQKKALEIGEAFAKLQAVQGIVMFLQQYGVSANLAMKVHKIFGHGAVEKIKENPFILADVDGITFKTADNIAFVMGVPKNSAERIKAGIKFILNTAAYSAGHTFLPKTLLLEDIEYNLGVDENEAENALTALALEHDVYLEDIDGAQVCYLSAFDAAEEYTARRLASLCMTEQKLGMGDDELDAKIMAYEEESGINLAYEQRSAVITAVKSSCVVITGGPGTGKTTTINTIIHILKDLSLSVALAAPTGRAAKRMSEVTGEQAKTIHRLLGVVPDSENKFVFNENNPLPADVVILDEVSMVDIRLMYSFLRALKSGARVILSGDADQLPPVGPGNVLRDIIESGMVPVIRLEQIFRQAEESLIVVNAHRINRSVMPELDAKNKDFFFLKRRGAEAAAKTIADLYKNRLPKSYGLDPVSSIQVLSPSKRGNAGVIRLNKLLQYAVNPPDMLKNEFAYGQTVFREGDKVMQVKNNYDIPWIKENKEPGSGIFNGDMGIIQKISVKDKLMTIVFDDDKEVEYQFAYLDELELAYAVTVHKSQGSEFPVVIIPACNFAPALMYKNILYTAVTRAKNMVILVGEEESVEKMVYQKNAKPRYTGLCAKIRQHTADFDDPGF